MVVEAAPRSERENPLRAEEAAVATDADEERTVLAELAADKGLNDAEEFVSALLSLRLRCITRRLPPPGLGSASPIMSDGQCTGVSELVAHCSKVNRLPRSGTNPSRSLLRAIFCALRSTCKYANAAHSMTILSGSCCGVCRERPPL